MYRLTRTKILTGLHVRYILFPHLFSTCNFRTQYQCSAGGGRKLQDCWGLLLEYAGSSLVYH